MPLVLGIIIWAGFHPPRMCPFEVFGHLARRDSVNRAIASPVDCADLVSISWLNHAESPAPLLRVEVTADLPALGLCASDTLLLAKVHKIDCDSLYLLSGYHLARVQSWGGGLARVTDEADSVTFQPLASLAPIGRVKRIEKAPTQ